MKKVIKLKTFKILDWLTKNKRHANKTYFTQISFITIQIKFYKILDS